MDIDYGTYEMSNKEKRKYFFLGYTMLFGLCLLFYHNLILSAAAGFLVVFFFGGIRRHLAARRREKMRVEFRDLLYSFSASMAAGRQITQALEEGVRTLETIHGIDAPLTRELAWMVSDIRENHSREDMLLADLARRSHLPDIRDFVDVYLVCRGSGGDLEKAVSRTAETLIDRMSIEAEIRAVTAQKKLEGRIISAMPPAVVLFLNVFSPDYLAVMYETLPGRFMMTGALIGIFLCYRWAMRMTEVTV